MTTVWTKTSKRNPIRSSPTVNGFKICKGPSHERPVRLPVESFYMTRTGPRAGEVISVCKRCESFRRKMRPKRKKGQRSAYVPIADFIVLRDELARRIGRMEAGRRMGIAWEHLGDYAIAKKKCVRRTTYQAAVRVLKECRANGEDGFVTSDDPKAHLTRERRAKNGAKAWSPEAREKRAAKIEALKASQKRSKMSGMAAQLQFYAERNQPDMSPPDSTWWVHDGYTHVPRYGEQMLGADF